MVKPKSPIPRLGKDKTKPDMPELEDPKTIGATKPLRLLQPDAEGNEIELEGGIEAILELNEDGLPSNPSVMIFLPNKYIDDPVLMGGPNHAVCIMSYYNMLMKHGASDEDAMNLIIASPGEGESETGEKVGVDILIRPGMNGANVCFRKPSVQPENWPQMIGRSIQTLQAAGVPDDNMLVFDFSKNVMKEALLHGNMRWMVPSPRTLVARQQFINDSYRPHEHNEDPGLLKAHSRVYYGVTGERQLMADDFHTFVEGVSKEMPVKSDVVKALGIIFRQATTTNNAGYRNLGFFGVKDDFTKTLRGALSDLIGAGSSEPSADSAEAGVPLEVEGECISPEDIEDYLKYLLQEKEWSGVDKATIKLVEGHLKENITEEDLGVIDWLDGQFQEAVPENLRSYDAETDDEECRENLLKRLLGEYDSSGGFEILGLKMRYLPRGSWLDGPIRIDHKETEKANVHYRAGVDVPQELRKLTQELAETLGAEYVAPYELAGAHSQRAATGLKEPTFLMFMGSPSYDKPYVRYAKDVGEMSKNMEQYLDEIYTGCRVFDLNVPDHSLIEVPTGEGGRQRTHFLVKEYLEVGRPVSLMVIERFEKHDEVRDREALLGEVAGKTAIIGRSSGGFGGVLFKMAPSGSARSTVLWDPQGAFNPRDLEISIEKSVDQYARHIARSMAKTHAMGASEEEVDEILATFVEEFSDAIGDAQLKMKELGRDKYLEPFDSDANPNIRKRMETALDRLESTNIDQAAKNLHDGAKNLYEIIAALSEGLEPGRDKNEAVMAIDQLMLVHPTKTLESIATLSSDEEFGSLSAIEMEDRADMLRIKNSVRLANENLGDVYGYMLDCIAEYGRYAPAYFEDHHRERFTMLNLRGKDARLIHKVFNNPQMKDKFKKNGYC